MKHTPKPILLGALLAFSSSLAHAQSPAFTSHYVPGSEGIKAASLPPPGVYVRDYNVFYFADRLNGPDGSRVPLKFDLSVYANVLRGLWVTDVEVLGGHYFTDALVPFQSTSLNLGGTSSSTFGIGDLYLEPAGISWHGKRWDAALGYSFWAPTGDSKPGSTKPGKGFWGHMLTAGGTVYLDPQKSWALSLLNRYEINHEEKDTKITPGNQWTLEWGLSKSVTPSIEVGLVGYYQRQITRDSGAGASLNRDQVVALGPEVNAFCSKLGLFGSLRYAYEFSAKDRAQGQTVVLTLTKPF